MAKGREVTSLSTTHQPKPAKMNISALHKNQQNSYAISRVSVVLQIRIYVISLHRNKRFTTDNRRRLDSAGYITPENRSGKNHAAVVVAKVIRPVFQGVARQDAVNVIDGGNTVGGDDKTLLF